MQQNNLSASSAQPTGTEAYRQNKQTIAAPTDGNAIRDLVCFSHLRWDFVFQRPQHLMTRAAQGWRVFFIEEPVFQDELDISGFNERQEGNVWVITPQLPKNLDPTNVRQEQENLVTTLLHKYDIQDYVAWYYTPMALAFTDKLEPKVIVYDCMDELSAFRGAPPELVEWEKELLEKADLVFTGGQSLYEAKCNRHHSVRAFPSSIDKAHFAKARTAEEPADQRGIKSPKFGFYGVVDERFDIELLRELSSRRPDWHFVIIGPVVKIDALTLPQNLNIHYLGMKSYDQLPAYLGGWDVALLLFARNESTRYISPTKTPEYLAAGKPVVSTSIRDVVRPYGEAGLVHIADTAEDFENAINRALADAEDPEWLPRVEAFLADNSWDNTWQQMQTLILEKSLETAPQQKTVQSANL